MGGGPRAHIPTKDELEKDEIHRFCVNSQSPFLPIQVIITTNQAATALKCP